MSRVSLILIAVLVAVVVVLVGLASMNTEVAPQRIEKPVKLQGDAGDAAPTP